MQKQKIKTTFNIEVEILNKLKRIANKKGTTQTEMMNKMLKNALLIEEESEKQKKVKGANFLKLAGIVTANEEFNAVEEVKKLRNGEL